MQPEVTRSVVHTIISSIHISVTDVIVVTVIRAAEDMYSETFLIVYIVVGDCILVLRLAEMVY